MAFETLGVTHVVWLPDSTLGTWECALTASSRLQLVRVCREGEAWALAAGLHLGGARPLVVMQNTGFFESGDSLRNVLFDLGLPLYSIVGYRSYLLADSRDTARRFTEPVLAAWGLDHVLVEGPEGLSLFVDHYHACQSSNRPGVALWAEGKG
jgi:sulfopyruvate decarboxylase TPP-binding subunit